MRTKINGISLNYELHGVGEPITFIHGLGDNLNIWVNQVPIFSQDYRVLTYDVRGFGRSDKPPGSYTVEAFAQELCSLLTKLGIERSIIVGFSMGGVIAMRFALDSPGMTAALVIASSSSEINQNAVNRFLGWVEKANNQGFAGLVDAYLEGRFHPDFVRDNPEFIAGWKEEWTGNDLHGWTQAALAMTRYNYTAELGNIRCPTLVVVGDKDVSVGVGGSVIMHRHIQGSQLEIIPNIGHGIAREKPEVFNRVLREFLDSLHG